MFSKPRSATCSVRSRACRSFGPITRKIRRSLRLRPGKLDHLAPLLGFRGDELAAVGWRARKRGGAEVGELRLQLGIGKAGVDLLVEPVDDLDGRVAGCADAAPGARFIARQKFRERRNVREQRQSPLP